MPVREGLIVPNLLDEETIHRSISADFNEFVTHSLRPALHVGIGAGIVGEHLQDLPTTRDFIASLILRMGMGQKNPMQSMLLSGAIDCVTTGSVGAPGREGAAINYLLHRHVFGDLVGTHGELLSLDSRLSAARLDALGERSRRHDDELEAAMGLPERDLDALGRFGAGEDEPGVARALRKRDEVLSRMGGDGNLVDPRDGPGLRLAANLLEHPSARD